MIARLPPPVRRFDGWTRLLALATAAGLIGSALGGGVGQGLGGVETSRLLLGACILVLLLVLRRRRTLAARAMRVSVTRLERPDLSSTGDDPGDTSALAQGVRDIHRMDPGFVPERFVGYAARVFRDTQSAWTTRDLGVLRDRVTPGLYGALQAQCGELWSARRVNRIEQVEITAEVTEAWHEQGRDYVTAHIRGSAIDYTVEEASDRLVRGSRTVPRDVEEFWTFARPGGLNFWMLSAIQPS